MLRQMVRARFLIGKSRIERLAGHGSVGFPSGWHRRNNTRALPIGKPQRTTSSAAGPKETSLVLGPMADNGSLLSISRIP